jgi:hypothetical protein
MIEYFKRLKTHSGWGVSLFITVLGMLAGSGNRSFQEWWQGALFGGITGFLFCLFVILFTNEKPK